MVGFITPAVDIVVLLVWVHLVPAVSVHRLFLAIVLIIAVLTLAAIMPDLPEVLMVPLVARHSVAEVTAEVVVPSVVDPLVVLVVAALAAEVAAAEAHALVAAVVATLEAEDNQQLFNRFTYNYDEENIFSSFRVCRHTARSCTGYL